MTNNNLLPLLLSSLLLPLLPALPTPDPAQSIHPNSSPPATTIPAFPEQSDDSGCPLDLPPDLFKNIKSACTGNKHVSGQLRRSRCCPVLGAWLYSAYSATALGKTIKQQQQPQPQQTASYYDLPLLPNDSETCIESLENRLRVKGIELVRVNESCDVVYCECGVRLHQLTCPEAFWVGSGGDLVGNDVVKRLEKDCLFDNGFPGLDGCSKCFKTLRLLNKGDTNKSEERSNKMRNEDCELMGLTWLLAKNRSAYIHTVSAVLRATMMNTDADSIPEACTLNSDGMPLAVDSYEVNASPSSSGLFNSCLTVSMVLLSVYVAVYQLLQSM